MRQTYILKMISIRVELKQITLFNSIQCFKDFTIQQHKSIIRIENCSCLRVRNYGKST